MVKWRRSYHSGTDGKIPLQSPGKFSIFPVLAQFFHLSFPKISHGQPNKNFIHEFNKGKSVSSQSLES